MKKRIAFDLDETLGTAISDGYDVVGFNLRQGCLELLDFISSQHVLREVAENNLPFYMLFCSSTSLFFTCRTTAIRVQNA